MGDGCLVNMIFMRRGILWEHRRVSAMLDRTREEGASAPAVRNPGVGGSEESGSLCQQSGSAV
jgi:hypothetical protein